LHRPGRPNAGQRRVANLSSRNEIISTKFSPNQFESTERVSSPRVRIRHHEPTGNTQQGNAMKKLILATTAALLIAAPAFAQTGANPSAPQANSTGTGVTQPGTTGTGTAVDRPQASGSSTIPRATGSQPGNNANSLSGPNAATGTTGMNSGTEGRTSGGGGGAGGGSN
jgi:hypothetical protein